MPPVSTGYDCSNGRSADAGDFCGMLVRRAGLNRGINPTYGSFCEFGIRAIVTAPYTLGTNSLGVVGSSGYAFWMCL